MKKIIVLLIALALAVPAIGQTTVPTAPQSASEPLMGASYKLFPTNNMWTFLKLDTRNGRIWTVQFTVKDDARYRYEVPLSTELLAEGANAENGRFTLYSTQNIYNFILLDQIDGRCWQVQWGESSFITRIY